MNPLAVILSFAMLAFAALVLYLLKDFIGPLAIAAVVLVLILFFIRR